MIGTATTALSMGFGSRLGEIGMNRLAGRANLKSFGSAFSAIYAYLGHIEIRWFFFDVAEKVFGFVSYLIETRRE